MSAPTQDTAKMTLWDVIVILMKDPSYADHRKLGYAMSTVLFLMALLLHY